MYFTTEVYYVKPEQVFGGYIIAGWRLWFIESNIAQDRQDVIMVYTFPAKPTKKQIRKLRRNFRKLL